MGKGLKRVRLLAAEGEETLDAAVMTEDVRLRVLRAMRPAVRKLARAARGIERFRDDHQRYACASLVRLAPSLFVHVDFRALLDELRVPHARGYHRRNTPEQAERLLAEIRNMDAAQLDDDDDDDDQEEQS